MEEENYFDKFVKDLEKREDQVKKQKEDLRLAEEQWQQRRKLEELYREKASNRVRYGK